MLWKFKQSLLHEKKALYTETYSEHPTDAIHDFLSISAPPGSSGWATSPKVSERHCCVTSVQDDWKVEQRDIAYYFLGCAHGDSSGINSLVLLTAYELGSITIHVKTPWKLKEKKGETEKKEIEGESTHPCPKYKLSILKQNPQFSPPKPVLSGPAVQYFQK